MKKLMHAIEAISSSDIATMRDALTEQIRSSITGSKIGKAERTNWPTIADAIRDYAMVGAVGYGASTPELKDAKVAVLGADGKTRKQSNTSERFETLWAESITEAIPETLSKDERDSRLNVAGVRKNRLKKLVGLAPDSTKKEHITVTLTDSDDPERLGKANLAFITAAADKLGVTEAEVLANMLMLATEQGLAASATSDDAGVSALDKFI